MIDVAGVDVRVGAGHGVSPLPERLRVSSPGLLLTAQRVERGRGIEIVHLFIIDRQSHGD